MTQTRIETSCLNEQCSEIKQFVEDGDCHSFNLTEGALDGRNTWLKGDSFNYCEADTDDHIRAACQHVTIQ